MPSFNFQASFAAAVESGQKTQTIRKTCRAKVGDAAYLYTGQRTKQCRKLGEGIVNGLHRVEISRFDDNRSAKPNRFYIKSEIWSPGFMIHLDHEEREDMAAKGWICIFCRNGDVV